MNISIARTKTMTVGGLLLAGAVLAANGTRCSDFTPLANSAGPAADESAPITLGNPDFQQRSNRTIEITILK